jgi:hypothetical protein
LPRRSSRTATATRRAAVNELVAIVGALIEENKALRVAASPGYARKPRPGLRR